MAIEKGEAGRAERLLTDAYHSIQKTSVLTGLSRTYEPLNDGDPETFPPESNPVQVKVNELLGDVRKGLSRLFDVVATKDWANTEAKADIIVDTQVLIENVPVSYLLFLEKQLTHLRTLITSLPTLPLARQWTWDSGQGVWVTAPVQKTRTKKVPKNHVKAEATDKHPAQVEVYHEDVPVGQWTEITYSGALEVTRVRQLRDRIDELVNAVKKAREEANTMTITEKAYAAALFDYLFS